MKRISIIGILLSCLTIQLLVASTTESTSAITNFPKVYSLNEGDKQSILKLYRDKTYEFLIFKKAKSKISEKRQTGTYKTLGKIIHLKKNGGGSWLLPKYLFYSKNQFLSAKPLDLFKKSPTPFLYMDTSSKYSKKEYLDSIFGKISNNRNFAKKIVKPNREKPNPVNNDIATTGVSKKDSSKIIDHTIMAFTPDEFKKLKAVLIVGIDDNGIFTDFISSMSEIANYLRNLGVQVIELYDSNATWPSILSATDSANILIYSGHGGDPSIFTRGSGSFYINGERSVSVPIKTYDNSTMYYLEQEVDISKLKLHKNALVIFNHACFSAGSSASDRHNITLEEATERVEKFSRPFLKIGVGGYYANNYSGSVIPFLENFFYGYTIKEAYLSSYGTQNQIIQPSRYKTNYHVGISIDRYIPFAFNTGGKKNSGPKKEKKITPILSYDIAYVGRKNFTVLDLLK